MLFYRYDTFEMLRENLDTVLKDLLEFKTKEDVPCKYPGSHLDLEENFLQQIKLPDKNSPKQFYNPFLDTITSNPSDFFNNTEEQYDFDVDGKETKQIVSRIRRYLDKKSKAMMKPISKMKRKLRKYMYLNPNQKRERIKRFSNKPQPKKRVVRRKFIIRSKEIRFGRRLLTYNTRYKRRRETTTKTTTVKTSTSEKVTTIGKKLVTTTTQKPYVTKTHKKTVKIIEGGDPADGDAAMKARFLFKSCMNYEILQKRGHQPLLDLLDLLGGWPILKPAWNATKFDWLELMAKLRLYNNDILISEWVGPDIKNSDEFVIQFDQTSLGNVVDSFVIYEKRSLYFKIIKCYRITYKRLFSTRYK